MGFRTKRHFPEILNALHDERVHGQRTFWTRYPLLKSGTFTDGTLAGLGAGTVGTLALSVPANQIWFLKKINVSAASYANGTAYVSTLQVDSIEAGTLASIVCDTVYGDLLVCVGSVRLTGTFGSVGTFLGTLNLGVEGYYTDRYGWSPNT